VDEVERQTLSRALELLAPYADATRAKSDAAEAEQAEMALSGRVRSRLQQAIIDLPGMIEPIGMRAFDISNQIDYSVSNCYRLLHSLARSGIAELVPGEAPQRWRLVRAHRYGTPVFAQLVANVLPGEWTSCSDVSIAARGDVFLAERVCWAAEHVPNFPHPQRVLLECGALHDQGHDHRRRCPREVQDLLAREGVPFTPAGRAASARRVAWDELRERARSDAAAAAEAAPVAAPLRETARR
jgi:hypothetical protein